jgi:murein DD-endopeptidase MepM/ murein hydrolase activator NlpD
VWKNSVSARGFLATYRTLFGDPFANDLGPPLPPDLQQPELILPWAADQVWNYTGGPHGGWGGGSAWAAVDFIPPDTRSGCYDSDEWVTAAAAGTVVRNAPGLVVVDLDDDGLEQTGWVINYLHMASRDWVAFVGARVRVGDWIGHPSCEGGIATGTHVHLARRYNGEWVPAGTPPVPLVLSGWQVVQGDSPYNGTMVKGDVTLTADTARSENNRVPH